MRLTTLCLALLMSVVACKDGDGSSSQSAVTGPAPDSFRVAFETSRGPFVVQVSRALSPKGADRFYELVQSKFFDDARFFRVVPGFVAQFGINDKPKVNDAWDAKTIPDEPVKETNARGTIVFATSGPDSRSHQLFINLVDNGRLDAMGFAPFGRVVEGMGVVDSLYADYGETPDQHMIQTLGNSYLERNFPKLDYIKSTRVETGAAKP
jgi:peptidyl-prolyl cis-trans isomerase A (cyclophilin A)